MDKEPEKDLEYYTNLSPFLGGYVSSNEIIVKKTGQFTQEGLLSEQIFGPINNYRCQCKKLSSEILEKDKYCDRCHVFCSSNNLRFKVFGKISTVVPIIKPTKKKYFSKIVGRQNKNLLDPILATVNKTSKLYLGVKRDLTELKIFADYKNSDANYYILPFRLTGQYSLIIALKFFADKLNIQIAKEFFDNKYVIDTISVLPAGIRPAHNDPKKPEEIRVTEINKHYNSILGLNKYNNSYRENIKTDEEDLLGKLYIIFKDQVMDQEIVESSILHYDSIASRYQYYTDLVYQNAFESLSGKEGLIRKDILGKTIEFSGRAVIICDPSINPYEVKVSKKILYKLWQPYFIYYLTNIKNMPYDDCFEQISPKTYEDNKLLFDEFLVWYYSE